MTEEYLDFYHIFKITEFIHFRKNLYLCHNEPLKMDTGDLLPGIIINAM
jgi:hypothetical protein